MNAMSLPSLRAIAKAYGMSIVFWFGTWLLMDWQYRMLNQLDLWSSFFGLLKHAGIKSITWSLLTPPMFYLVSSYLSLPRRSVYRHLLVFGCGVVPFVLLQTAIDWAVMPPFNDQLQKAVPRSFHLFIEMLQTSFADQIWDYISIVVAAHAYDSFQRLRRQDRERYEYQQALAASELQALKMQLHPHFLFNTLNGIATLVSDEPEHAKMLIVKLSSLLRTALDRGNSDLIPLHEELKFVEDYLDIEKMRLGDRLRIGWNVAPETRSFLVPQMIVQPLVENAIRHGVASSREIGWVELAVTESSGALRIQVRNSVGPKRSDGTGVGLINVKRRLDHLYSGEANFRFSIAEDRTATAELTMPALDSQLQQADEAHAESAEKES
jgi:two-component system LytT family sensor kinase